MLPLKMQSRSKTQPKRPWMSEPGLLVGRKAHQPSESVNLAKNQSREQRQLRRSDSRRPVAQSFAAPLKPKFLLLGVHDSLDATLTHRFHKGAAAAPPMSAMKSRCFTASGLPCFDRKVAH